MPDLSKNLIVTILVDENQKKNIKELELCAKQLFKPKQLRFIVLCDSIPDDVLQSDFLHFVLLKEDFNMFGVFKKDKEVVIRSCVGNVFINMSDNNELMLNDYLVSMIGSTFKIGHVKSNNALHDLIMDFGIEKSNVERMKIIYKYLMMLSGNNYEK